MIVLQCFHSERLTCAEFVVPFLKSMISYLFWVLVHFMAASKVVVFTGYLYIKLYVLVYVLKLWLCYLCSAAHFSKFH